MTAESVTIYLPLPDARLSPNRQPGTRGGRMAQANAARLYRKVAKSAVELAGIDSAPWPAAEAAVTFYWPDARRRDPDNAAAMLKPAYDGIVDSGLIDDDDYHHLKRMPPVFEIDRKTPRVEITLTRKATAHE